jgi:hypothetical protein
MLGDLKSAESEGQCRGQGSYTIERKREPERERVIVYEARERRRAIVSEDSKLQSCYAHNLRSHPCRSVCGEVSRVTDTDLRVLQTGQSHLLLLSSSLLFLPLLSLSLSLGVFVLVLALAHDLASFPCSCSR